MFMVWLCHEPTALWASTTRFDVDIFCNAKNPSSEQFPSGIYELLIPSPLSLGLIARVIVVVDNDGITCRARTMIPSEVMRQGTSTAYRRMTGVVKVKFGQSYYLMIQNQDILEFDEKLFLTIMLGIEEPTQRTCKGVCNTVCAISKCRGLCV